MVEEVQSLELVEARREVWVQKALKLLAVAGQSSSSFLDLTGTVSCCLPR